MTSVSFFQILFFLVLFVLLFADYGDFYNSVKEKWLLFVERVFFSGK